MVEKKRLTHVITHLKQEVRKSDKFQCVEVVVMENVSDRNRKIWKKLLREVNIFLNKNI